MKKWIFAMFLGLLSCDHEDVVRRGPSFQDAETHSGVWVCHNENSPRHEKLCSEECYENGNQSAFCWHLESAYCETPDFHVLCEKAR